MGFRLRRIGEQFIKRTSAEGRRCKLKLAPQGKTQFFAIGPDLGASKEKQLKW
jgi:hypothetical protein